MPPPNKTTISCFLSLKQCFVVATVVPSAQLCIYILYHFKRYGIVLVFCSIPVPAYCLICFYIK